MGRQTFGELEASTIRTELHSYESIIHKSEQAELTLSRAATINLEDTHAQSFT